MDSLDENVVTEVCKLLESVTNDSQEVQDEIFNDIQSFKSLDQINLYLLAAIGNEELSDYSRCTAAILMRHYFISCTNKIVKECFKNNVFQVVLPFFTLPPSPLTNCVSALFAELLKYFGFDVFPQIPEVISQLLDDSDSSESGLSLIYECLLQGIDLNPEIIEVMQAHLTTEHSSFVLKICGLFAYRYPNEVKELILSVVFQAEFEELSKQELIETIEICRICLERSEYEETIVEFLVLCINSGYQNVSTNAAEIFEYFEVIPFYEEVVTALYQKLSTNTDVFVYNNSLQCLYSLSAYAHRYQEESVPLLMSFFEQCTEESDNDTIINMLRGITTIADLLEDPDQVALKANAMFQKNPEETVYCWAFMCPHCPSIVGPALEAISPLITSDKFKLRVQVMKNLPIIMHYGTVPAEPLTSLFIQCLDTFTLWDKVLLCETLASFFVEVNEPESSENCPVLIQKLCTLFMECEELDPFLFASLKVFPTIPRNCPSALPMLMEIIGEKMFESVSSDDTELATGALDFYISIINAGQSEAISQLLETIIGTLPSSNWLGSQDETRKTRGWRFIHALALNNEALFATVAEWVQPGACAEMDGQFMPSAIDEICSTLFDLIGVMEIPEDGIMGIFNLLKYSASVGFISQNVAACFVKLMGMFPEAIVIEEPLMNALLPVINSFEGIERYEACSELMSAYLQVHPMEPVATEE